MTTPDLGSYRGVWFWVEQFEGEASSISWEMAGKGRALADQLAARGADGVDDHCFGHCVAPVVVVEIT